MKFDWKKVKEDAQIKEDHHVKEQLITKRIVNYIVIGLLLVIVAISLSGYFYIKSSLTAVNPEQTATKEVTIPIGSTSRDIANILYEQQLIKNADIFKIYMKLKSVSDLQAGHYQLSPSMDSEQIIGTLAKGGRPIEMDVDTTVTVVEGMQLEQIAQVVGEKTDITKEEFLKVANNKEVVERLTKQFPSLLTGLAEIEGLKYPLEGYLYPATYDYVSGMDAESLLTAMVGKMNIEYQHVKDSLANTYLNFHQVLTLASIIEKEGVTEEDRGLISGVFYNRLNEGMPLQSDITVLYALGQHKELVTYKDLEVDSPYNLYQHTGLGPGPFNSPSIQAIQAAIHPTATEYYYFVADIRTGDVYYATTFEEHEALVAKYVNQDSNESQASTLSEAEEE